MGLPPVGLFFFIKGKQSYNENLFDVEQSLNAVGVFTIRYRFAAKKPFIQQRLENHAASCFDNNDRSDLFIDLRFVRFGGRVADAFRLARRRWTQLPNRRQR